MDGACSRSAPPDRAARNRPPDTDPPGRTERARFVEAAAGGSRRRQDGWLVTTSKRWSASKGRAYMSPSLMSALSLPARARWWRAPSGHISRDWSTPIRLLDLGRPAPSSRPVPVADVEAAGGSRRKMMRQQRTLDIAIGRRAACSARSSSKRWRCRGERARRRLAALLQGVEPRAVRRDGACLDRAGERTRAPGTASSPDVTRAKARGTAPRGSGSRRPVPLGG